MKDYSDYNPNTRDKLLWSAEILFKSRINDNGIEVPIDGDIKKVIIMTKYSEQNNNGKLRFIIGYKEDIYAGAYVEYQERFWLIIEVPKDNCVHKKATMHLCSSENLKWKDENGIVHSYPCIFEFNHSNFGVKDDKVMSLPDGRRKVVVKRNEHTEKLVRDKRFIFGRKAYIVVDDDYVSDEGLVKLTLKDDQVSVMDNLELGIANYYGEDVSPEIISPVEDGYTIAITGYDEIYKGDIERYEVTLYKNGNPVVEDVVWELFADNEVDETDLATIKEQTNEYCKVDSKSSNGYIKLKVSLVSDSEVFAVKRIRLRLY